MTIIVHENIGKELDDYLERRLRNYEVITPPIPKKPEIVTLEDDDRNIIKRIANLIAVLFGYTNGL